MDAVIVYAFDYFNRDEQRWCRGPVPATLAAIHANGWRSVEGSGRQVFADSVASSGVAYRWAAGQDEFAAALPD